MPDRVKSPCVYVLASARNGTLYIGVTSDLFQRIALHKQDLIEGFTKQHRVHRLVYYEMHATMDAAIGREKQLEEWRRQWKIRPIESIDPEWVDLFDEATGENSMGPRSCRGAYVDQESAWRGAWVPAWSHARLDGHAWRRDDECGAGPRAKVRPWGSAGRAANP
jgi:putative endonuclease